MQLTAGGTDEFVIIYKRYINKYTAEHLKERFVRYIRACLHFPRSQRSTHAGFIRDVPHPFFSPLFVCFPLFSAQIARY